MITDFKLANLCHRVFVAPEMGRQPLVESPKCVALASALLSHLSGKGLDGGHEFFGAIEDWSTVSLVDFRGEWPGLQRLKLLEVVHLPMNYRETRVHMPLSAAALAQRLDVASACGVLLMTPGECLAVHFEYESGGLGVKGYACNDEGRIREVHGLYAASLDSKRQQKSVADLNVHQTKTALAELTTTRLFLMASGLLSRQEVEDFDSDLTLLEEQLTHAPPERTSSGAVVQRWREESRTPIDRLCRAKDGWVHYDTYETAWYFGAWVHPGKLETMTYSEGDVSHVKCDSADQFFAELKAMAEFYGKSRKPCAIGYDRGVRTAFFDTLTFLSSAAKEVKLWPTGSGQQAGESASCPLFLVVDLEHSVFKGLEPWQELSLPSESFQLDLYNPLAFLPVKVVAQRGRFVFVVKSDGRRSSTGVGVV